MKLIHNPLVDEIEAIESIEAEARAASKRKITEFRESILAMQR